ncbi:hypothetical protein KIH74_03705 [Kineosporia sp. J2-2]|uniref:Uncharacterized protein n=1 Tax=Kineosporia corallincola TaxID=2835133 RepID=A0ABS5TC78_9ACTN|nr:hypothetical protein [Kineosporia corallincola]MBT0768014.1 hypothetical protein [Kineosporia corallincola]
MHANLYNFELIKLQHAEDRRLANDAQWVAVARRARRRTRRALWTKVTPGQAPTRPAIG